MCLVFPDLILQMIALENLVGSREACVHTFILSPVKFLSASGTPEENIVLLFK